MLRVLKELTESELRRPPLLGSLGKSVYNRPEQHSKSRSHRLKKYTVILILYIMTNSIALRRKTGYFVRSLDPTTPRGRGLRRRLSNPRSTPPALGSSSGKKLFVLTVYLRRAFTVGNLRGFTSVTADSSRSTILTCIFLSFYGFT